MLPPLPRIKMGPLLIVEASSENLTNEFEMRGPRATILAGSIRILNSWSAFDYFYGKHSYFFSNIGVDFRPGLISDKIQKNGGINVFNFDEKNLLFKP